MTTEVFKTLEATTSIDDVENYSKAMLNILEDFAEEKRRFEETHRAALNILEDFADEKTRLEGMQRAMLNLLDDFGMEREKTEAINLELLEAESQIKNSLGEKEALLREIHHRVKNNLQVVHSMLNLQLPHIVDKKAIEMFKESKDRVYSMALVHEQLYQSESLAKIDLDQYIPRLTANLFRSYGMSKLAIVPKIHVEKISLGIDTVIPCALIINELVSNSLKHAFIDVSNYTDEQGEVCVNVYHDSGNKFILTVSDNGIGFPKDFKIENCETLGLKLVSILVKQLKGTIRLNTRGKTEFIIKFESLK